MPNVAIICCKHERLHLSRSVPGGDRNVAQIKPGLHFRFNPFVIRGSIRGVSTGIKSIESEQTQTGPVWLPSTCWIHHRRLKKPWVDRENDGKGQKRGNYGCTNCQRFGIARVGG